MLPLYPFTTALLPSSVMAPVEAARELKRALRATAHDLKEGLRRSSLRDAFLAELSVLPTALKDTAPWLLRARKDADLSLIRLVLEHAEANPDSVAIEMADEKLTWRDLADKTSRIAHVLQGLGVRKGDIVALLGQNSPAYVANVLGISRIGATAALINYHLEGDPLKHALLTSRARVALVETDFLEIVGNLDGTKDRDLVSYGPGELEEAMDRAPSMPFPRVRVSVSSDYVYIYTSGTTGLPKPSRVTHARALAAGAGFGHLVHAFRPGDKLYCALPLYHSSALVLGLGSCLLTGTPMALRKSFSASAFWRDVQRHRATHMIYIGELCRYLLNTEPCEEERHHRLRVAVGNGLRGDVWESFQRRFGVETIREFYAATEAPSIILNLSGRPGAVGRLPLRRLWPMRIVRYDPDRDTHPRDDAGHCIECGPNEPGELLIRLSDKPLTAMSEFRGYTDPEATRKKIMTDVFRKGDKYYRSGDLLRYDEDDYFYFVDRIGDTYRWKGENVSTAEVEDVLSRALDLEEITVVGVRIPGQEGQTGLAAIVTKGDFDPATLFHAAQRLPAYAQPRFVRVMKELATTGTLKIKKSTLRSQGADPKVIDDALFVRGDDGYVPLTPALWDDVVEGRWRL